MYGYLTRSITDFFPNRLLCKRFNVKDPHPVPAGEEENKETVDTSLINAEAVKELKREARGGQYDLANIEPDIPVEIHADRNEALEGERAGEEVFKSIFGDDSDDE
jgi:G patch domain-containing protein 1